jgi:hypothetical protein
MPCAARPAGFLRTRSGPIPPFDVLELNRLGSLYVTSPAFVTHTQERSELLRRANELFAEIERSYPLSEARDALEPGLGRRIARRWVPPPTVNHALIRNSVSYFTHEPASEGYERGGSGCGPATIRGPCNALEAAGFRCSCCSRAGIAARHSAGPSLAAPPPDRNTSWRLAGDCSTVVGWISGGIAGTRLP